MEEHKEMKNQKGLMNSIIVIVVLVVIILVGAYLVLNQKQSKNTSTTPSPTPSTSQINSSEDLDKTLGVLDATSLNQIDTDIDKLNTESSSF